MYDDRPDVEEDAFEIGIEARLHQLARISGMPNIADVVEDERLSRIGSDVLQMHAVDQSSMSDWVERMERGIKLATLAKERKDYPFPNSANVKYPLVTTAALQFNARAYPAIVASEGAAKVKTHGDDALGAKAARSERVQEYLNYQLSAEIEEWESETDKLLVQLPIVGKMVRKIWYDPVKGRQCCRVIDPKCLVINDKVKSLEEAPRVGEEISLYPYEITSRIRSGQFTEGDYSHEEDGDDQTTQTFIEQHCRLDLDEDGYEEPYIVTVHRRTQKVARITADFDPEDIVHNEGQIVSIQRGSYFIDYEFLPSMDGQPRS